MTGPAYGTNLIVTLILGQLIASIVAVEWRSLRWSVLAVAAQSAVLAGIFVSFASLPGASYLWAWAAVTVATKTIILPALMWRFVKRQPEQEVEMATGFRMSVALVVILTVIAYRLLYSYIGFLSPTAEPPGEPIRSSLAVAYTVFALALYVLIARRGAVKIVIGLVLAQNAVHLLLVTLAPALPYTALLGILTNVIVTAGLLLYMSGAFYHAPRVAEVVESSTRVAGASPSTLEQ